MSSPITGSAIIHDANWLSGKTDVPAGPQSKVHLQDLLVVYPIVTSIIKNLGLRELISLVLTNKICFAFLRGRDWNADNRRWDNLRSNYSEVCEFGAIHEYLPPITAIEACHGCKHGVCDVSTEIILH